MQVYTILAINAWLSFNITSDMQILFLRRKKKGFGSK